MPSLSKTDAYGWMMLAGIFVSIALWSRVARRDERLVLIYVAALVGAFLGAKIVYLGAEGWLHWHDQNRWIELATGKSITGALLGGYAAVEIAKHFLTIQERPAIGSQSSCRLVSCSVVWDAFCTAAALAAFANPRGLP